MVNRSQKTEDMLDYLFVAGVFGAIASIAGIIITLVGAILWWINPVLAVAIGCLFILGATTGAYVVHRDDWDDF